MNEGPFVEEEQAEHPTGLDQVIGVLLSEARVNVHERVEKKSILSRRCDLRIKGQKHGTERVPRIRPAPRLDQKWLIAPQNEFLALDAEHRGVSFEDKSGLSVPNHDDWLKNMCNIRSGKDESALCVGFDPNVVHPHKNDLSKRWPLSGKLKNNKAENLCHDNASLPSCRRSFSIALTGERRLEPGRREPRGQIERQGRPVHRRRRISRSATSWRRVHARAVVARALHSAAPRPAGNRVRATCVHDERAVVQTSLASRGAADEARCGAGQ
jgi:hypothetical protein